MNSKVNEIKRTLEDYFIKHPEIEVVYIFGSVAKEQTNDLSDVDIGVILNYEKIEDGLYPYGYKANMLTDLMKLLKTNKVDLVILNNSSPLLKHRVLYFGKIIYLHDKQKHIRFQIDTINRYNDFKYLSKPHLDKIGVK